MSLKKKIRVVGLYMVKCIGIKDCEGNNVGLITNNNPLPHNFYDNYKLKEVWMTQGDNMARMIVTKIS